MFASKRQSLLVDLLTTDAGAAENVRSPRLQPLLQDAQAMLEQIELELLDPLLERLLELWGDRRNRQHQALDADIRSGATASALTADERQINRGLYVSAGSLGLAVAGALFFSPLSLLSLPGLTYSSWRVYKQAYQALVEAHTVDITVLTALVNTAYIAGGFFVLGNLTTTSYFFSVKLLSVVKDRLEQEVFTALTAQPQAVWVLVDGQEVKRTLDQVNSGDVVVVQAGEVVPVDGVVTGGVAAVDQHVLTGEARPVEKTVGDSVFAASTVLTGKLFVAVEEAGAETTVAKISQILAQTVDFRSTRQLQLQQLTDRLVAPVLGLAALSLPFLGPWRAVAVIDTHPHRQLNILGSLGMLNFLVAATEQGILVKDGRSLELLSQVDTLIFDKTGTLTQEQPRLTAIHLCADYTEAELLAYAAAAEQRQSHPIARAIRAAARSQRLSLPSIDYASYKMGLGLAVTAVGRAVHVGSARFMAMEGIAIPPAIEQVQESCRRQGHSLTMVAIEGQLAGAIELQAALRPEARTVVAALRQLPRIRSIIVVSGDQPAPTERLALEIGADGYYAEVLPADKANLIAQLQQAGRRICFVGDGINDAIALKQANVSISLRGATTAATDTAHIVLMDESLQQLPPLFDLVERFDATTRNILLTTLGPGAVGLVGIYFLGFGLAHIMILNQVGLALGTGIAMRPWLQQRRLAAKTAAASEG